MIHECANCVHFEFEKTHDGKLRISNGTCNYNNWPGSINIDTAAHWGEGCENFKPKPIAEKTESE